MTTTTADPFKSALDALNKAYSACETASKELPTLPCPLPKCCKEPSFKILERGYTRCTTIAEDELCEGLAAYTDGFDDYSEEGEFQYVFCASCLTRWKTPEGLDYY